MPSPDYPTHIRASIEADAQDLRDRLWLEDKVEADTLLVGYAINGHKGHQVIGEGATVAGLTLESDRANPRTISVEGDTKTGGRARVSTTW
jgi:hypothetical protein